MADRLVLGAGSVRIRHIRKGTGDGQVTVLGQAYYPSWSGMNGRRGFQVGQYEIRLDEEGTFSLTFPNTTGDDGVLHRDRFLILTAGKRTPLSGGGAYAYSGGTYRPGDEWIEVWYSEPGQIIFIGTPTQAKITRDRVEISGYDARWLLKKTRETSAGFWMHAPRDVWEHYCSVWHSHVASDFESEVFTWSTGATTYNNEWVYTRASTGSDGAPPSSVRLLPNAATETATLRSYVGIDVGRDSVNADNVWRVETRFLRSALGSGAYVQVGMLDGSSVPWAYVQFTVLSTTIKTGSYTAKDVGLDTSPPGPFHVIVEGRDRWVYFYSNGKLLGTMPMPFGTTSGKPYVAVKAGSTTSHEYADVDFFIARNTEPFLMRGDDPGDYFLPGLPPSGPLMGEYFSDTELKPYGTGWGTSDYYDMVLNPPKDSYAVRGDSALNFGMGIGETLPTWQPSGPAGEYFSARWTGSMYLDLENYDYRFRALVSDGFRLHVGKSKTNDHLVNTWTSQTPVYTTASDWLKADRNFPAVAGWYPVVGEYMQGEAAGVCIVQAQRDDWPTTAWVPLGLSQLDATVLSDGPSGYWRLGEGGGATITTAYDSINGVNGTYGGSPNTAYNTAPLIPGDLCVDFDGSDDVVTVSNAHGYVASPFTVEAWIAADTISTDRPIVSKMEDAASGSADGWELYLESTDSKAYFRRLVNGSAVGAVSASAITAGLWTHVVGVYDHQSLFYDDFEDGVIGSIWTDGGQDPDTVVTESGGTLNFAYDGSGTGYSTYRSTSSTLNFTGTRTIFEVVSRGHTQSGWQLWFEVHGNNSDTNEVKFGIDGTQLQAWKDVGGTQTNLANATWNATTMRYLGIRETSGTTYWEYSSDALTWTTLHSAANPITMTGGYLLVVCGVYSAVSATTGKVGMVSLEKPMMTVYVNGTAGTPVSDARPMIAHADVLRIGDYPDTYSATLFDGRISRVSIYNKALTATQVTAHYNARWAYEDLQFSPFGVFRSHVRFDSHYDVLRTLAETFGYQSTTIPYQLESGLFPGQCPPRVRVGRDTAKELDAVEATEIAVDVNAEDVCDSLFADAQGLGDEELVQLTAEGIRFEEISDHMLIAQEYDSLSDIAFPPLLDQRLNSLLALRGSVWEQVSARPPGFRELLDAFPLPDTPEFQEFAWEPGDGVRLNILDIGIADPSPRQILGIQRSFVPDGIGRPVVSFRQRPRNLKDMMRKLARGPLVYRRNFQGQIISLSGSIGGKNDANVTDPFSRASLPYNVEEVVKGTLYILNKANTSSWSVEINGTNRFSVVSVGTYEITAWAKPDASNPQINVQLTGGSGVVVYKTEFLVRLAHG